MDAAVRTAPPQATAPGVLVRLSEVAADADDDFHLWYQRHQLTEPLAVEGFRAARRYRVAGGEPTYMTVYECRSIDVLAAPASQAALAGRGVAPRGSSARVRDTLQFACRETWSMGEGLGGSAIVVQCKPMQGRESAARDFIRESFGPGRMPALVRMSLWEADPVLGAAFAPPAPQPPAPSARRGRAAGTKTVLASAAEASLSAGPRWVLSLQSYDVARMALAVHAQLLGWDSGTTGLLVGSWARYQLVCAHGSLGSQVQPL